MKVYLQRARESVDLRLPRKLAEFSWHPDLQSQVRYVMVGGGKALRPALVFWAHEQFVVSPGTPDFVHDWALAVEMLHTYSLVHDDLPAMDNDDLRRGKPTLHKLHGDAAAILAGDAMLTGAFELIASSAAPPERSVQATVLLARASGANGMISGQLRDILEPPKLGVADNLDALERVHVEKTGALIACSLQLGALAAGAAPQLCADLARWGLGLGLMFQVVDDVLDATQGSRQLGKSVGKDLESGKRTYVSLLGIEGARKKVEELRVALAEAAAPLFPTGKHMQLIDFVARRGY